MSFHSVDEFLEGIEEIYKSGWKPGLSTGWPNLDKFYTVRECEFTIVTGMPSHGKSEFLTSLMVNLAKLHDWRLAIVSPEHQPIERYICMIIEKYAEKTFDEKRGPKISRDELQTSIAWIRTHFCFYGLNEDNPPLVKAVFKDLDSWQQDKGKFNGLFLDPYNEFDHSRTTLDSKLMETEYISRFLSDLRRSARVRKLHLWLVAHPAKPQQAEDGSYDPIDLYHIAGSAHFRNKADNGLSIYRNDLENRGDYTTVFIRKIKFREIGKQGRVYFTFDESTGKFSEHELNGSKK